MRECKFRVERRMREALEERIAFRVVPTISPERTRGAQAIFELTLIFNLLREPVDIYLIFG